MEVLRSPLFVPGSNMRQIHKTKELNADAYVLDLEDAVSLGEKETARIFIRDSVEFVGSEFSKTYVRTNGLGTGMFEEDLEFIPLDKIDGLMLPMIEKEKDILKSIEIISEFSNENEIDLIPTIETAKGVENAYEICSCSERIIAIGFGAVDFATSMGIELTEKGNELFYPRAKVTTSALANGVQPIDTVFPDIGDRNGLIKDSKVARQLGFKGKWLIHPNQIDPVNKIFSPSQEEIGWAKKVVEKFEDALDRGLGVIEVDGEMIDEPVYEREKEIVDFAEAIKARESK